MKKIVIKISLGRFEIFKGQGCSTCCFNDSNNYCVAPTEESCSNFKPEYIDQIGYTSASLRPSDRAARAAIVAMKLLE